MTYPDPKPEAERLLALVSKGIPAPINPLDGDDLVLLPTVRLEVDRLFDYIAGALTPAMAHMVQNSWVCHLTRSVAPADAWPFLLLQAEPWRIRFDVAMDPCFASSPAWLSLKVFELERKSRQWKEIRYEEIGCLAELPDRWEWRFVDAPHRGKSTGGGVPMDKLAPLLPERIRPYLDMMAHTCVRSCHEAAAEMAAIRRKWYNEGQAS